jgi:hypothetical protein
MFCLLNFLKLSIHVFCLAEKGPIDRTNSRTNCTQNKKIVCLVHIQIDDGSAETLTAKLAFEQYAAKHGVKILTITATMGAFTTTASSKHAMMQGSNSPFVG